MALVPSTLFWWVLWLDSVYPHRLGVYLKKCEMLQCFLFEMCTWQWRRWHHWDLCLAVQRPSGRCTLRSLPRRRWRYSPPDWRGGGWEREIHPTHGRDTWKRCGLCSCIRTLGDTPQSHLGGSTHLAASHQLKYRSQNHVKTLNLLYATQYNQLRKGGGYNEHKCVFKKLIK